MRFLHTADWHLGRIFHQTHLTDDQAYVLDQLTALIADMKPDALLISGDVYDRGVPPYEAVSLLDDTLSKIILDYHTPVIMIAGNHDSAERLNFGEKLLARQNLHVAGMVNLAQKPVVLQDSYGPVYFLPFPYAEPALIRAMTQAENVLDHDQAFGLTVKALLPSIPPRARKVALAHAFVAGGLTSDSERQLSVGGSGAISKDHFSPFHYAALGHLHSAQKITPTVQYSGSLLKYSFAEARQVKGLNCVEMDEKGEVRVEQIRLSPRRDLRILEGFFNDLLHEPPVGNPDDYLLVRLKDTGAILDPISRLRQVYPNVLSIERPGLIAPALQHSHFDFRQSSDESLFLSFYEQMTGTALNAEQKTELETVLSELDREEREGKQ